MVYRISNNYFCLGNNILFYIHSPTTIKGKEEMWTRGGGQAFWR